MPLCRRGISAGQSGNKRQRGNEVPRAELSNESLWQRKSVPSQSLPSISITGIRISSIAGIRIPSAAFHIRTSNGARAAAERDLRRKVLLTGKRALRIIIKLSACRQQTPMPYSGIIMKISLLRFSAFRCAQGPDRPEGSGRAPFREELLSGGQSQLLRMILSADRLYAAVGMGAPYGGATDRSAGEEGTYTASRARARATLNTEISPRAGPE